MYQPLSLLPAVGNLLEVHISKMAENSQQPLPKRHDLQTSADLERVTDYAEEKEISTTDIENVSSVLFQL